jgi:hypothetical protein
MRQAEQTGVAGIPADMPSDVRVEVQKLFSPDPAVRATAVQVLVKIGQRAESAAPFLAHNVVTPTPGQLSHSTWLNILTNPQETSVALEQTGLPDLKALVDILRERRNARLTEGKDKESPDRPRPLRDRLRQKQESATEPKQP